MGLASATTTALNGMRLNETSIDVLGNNVANAGTRGFKSSEALFTTQLVSTLSSGDGPAGSNGGTNPRQIGLGGTVSTIRKDFKQGSVTTSNSPTDMAIEGEGFFVVKNGLGTQYTRDGSFTLNPEGKLVNPAGGRVQGYGIDGNYNLQTAAPVDIEIPLGKLYIAEATNNATFTGAFFSGGELATNGTVQSTLPLQDANGGGPGIPGPPSPTTPLQDLTSGGTSLFIPGDNVTFSGRKGDRDLPMQEMPVTGSTVQDLMSLMERVLGIQNGPEIPADGFTGDPPGVQLDGDTIRITGNRGAANALQVNPGDLRSGGAVVLTPFQKQADAVGESAVRDIIVYDSLGQEVNIRLTAVLEERSSTRTGFRWYADSDSDSGPALDIGTGRLEFDGTGDLVSGQKTTITVMRDDNAALSPLTIDLDFSQLSGISSALQGSNFVMESQDGAPPGTLVDFAIGESGGISGVFDNGLLRPLGRLVIAQFSNVNGLVEGGGGTYTEGPNSGPPRVGPPGAFGAGLLRAGAIELSNTDIGKNLVDLIIASTNYRGNARVISSTQELTDELLRLGR
ncbi:flagellar hook-basal body complex protein [Alienimonas californiensis]|uniref:Flagellar hook protein FlgE n=1 Tax=Alienimonas californiensis TaxID=2527989 RepID=A0A517PE35_9PLAN|nr:flagellar hook-basal body complex protein [Alienimonas californiensis]QDT17634.1 Flagellar hook protein FlgE [Alienimonas californiensis]